MLSFLMGKRKRRGERPRMGNNHSKIDDDGQSRETVVKDSSKGKVNETNLTDDEKGSENITEALPTISSTSPDLSGVPRNEVKAEDFSTLEISSKESPESEVSRQVLDNSLLPRDDQVFQKHLDETTSITNIAHSDTKENGTNITHETAKIEEKVNESPTSLIGSAESPITCHEGEQVLRITRVHSLDSSSEGTKVNENQFSSPVVPAVTKCDGWGAGQSAAKTLTDLEKSRKAFFMGLLEETVEEIYPEDVKYDGKLDVIGNNQEQFETSSEKERGTSTECAVSDVPVIKCSDILVLNKDTSDQNVVSSSNIARQYEEGVAQPEERRSDVFNFDDLVDGNDLFSASSTRTELEPREEHDVKTEFNPDSAQFYPEKEIPFTEFDDRKSQISEENSVEPLKKLIDLETEDAGVKNLDVFTVEPNYDIKYSTVEDEEHSDMDCDDEESGIVGNSDVASLNDVSFTNTIDDRLATDSGLENDENPDFDEVLHTELDDISLEEFETTVCEAGESISIDLVITEMKCDGFTCQAPDVVIEKAENDPGNRAGDPGHSGNDAKLDELGNCVETGEGESDDRPREGLGTGLPGPRGGFASVHCAIPRDEHRVDMLTLSNGAYETFPRSNLSLASSSDESIGIKVKKHVRWADTDDGRSLESYDSYSSCSSSEEESGSEDGVNQDVDVPKDEAADVGGEDDEDDDDDDTSESEEESESDEEENKTGAEDTFTESEITFVNVESANHSNDKLEEDECDEDEEEEMEDDETDTKTEENLVEKVIKLQEELLAKAASLERAQSDLDAAVLEADKNRKKIERLQEELDSLKRRNADLQQSIDEGTLGWEEKQRLESRIKQLEEELQSVRTERNHLENRLSSLERERDQEIQMVQRALEETLKEQSAREAKYQKEFETERTLSSQRELQMLEDFEWKLRETEKNAKKKVEGAEAEAARRVQDMEARLARAEADLERLAELKLCEIELKQLKVTSAEQRRNLRHVTRQYEELQVNEKILQEEVNRLRIAIDKEKLTITNLQALHKDELAEKDRKHRVKLEVQVSQITSEWEDRLRRELSKLKADLENTYREEKIVAVDMAKLLKDQEIVALKQAWEKKVKDFKKEITEYKEKLEEMKNSHKQDIENAQTSSDRDTLDLRRKMDKLDMEYQSKIEKMQEEHETELNELRQECEKKIAQIESTYQLQAGTTRTTIELVKQQMVNENQARIDRLQAMHRQQMEEQWEMLDMERRNEVRGLEDAHRAALEQLRKELDEIRKVGPSPPNSQTVIGSFFRYFTQAVAPTGSKHSNRQKTPIPESAKQMVIDQLNHEATNPYSCGDLDGIEAVSTGSDAEKILFGKLQQLTRQANEDKAEIERLRLCLEEKECGKQTQQTQSHQQQQQPQKHQQQHPPHPTRRNRKRRN